MATGTGRARAGPLFAKQLDAEGRVAFEIADVGDYPRTLVSYPVFFEKPGIRASDLYLVDVATAKPLPFQLSDIRESDGELAFAYVSFFCSVAGAPRSFELRADQPPVPATPSRGRVQIRQEDHTLVLDAGSLLIRVPDSQNATQGTTVPGPILGISRRGDGGRAVQWGGSSHLISAERTVQRIHTERIDSGPLFATCRVTYEFDRGATFVATIRSVLDYDFFEYTEEVAGLTREDDARVQMAWHSFSPTHRAFPLESGVVQRGIRVPFDKLTDGRTPGVLVTYCPHSRFGSYAAFWNANNRRTIGVFSRNPGLQWGMRQGFSAFVPRLPVTFEYTDGRLHWTWPLATGSRFTGIACCGNSRRGASIPSARRSRQAQAATRDPERDRLEVRPTGERWKPIADLSDNYGLRHLDYAKDWLVAYPASSARPPVIFPGGPLRDPARELLKDITGQNAYFRLIHGYNRSHRVMSTAAVRRIDAHILRAAYGCASKLPGTLESPVAQLTPHALADQNAILPAVTFLLPEHSMAGEWLDQYEKFLELTMLFNTRPTRLPGEARGGRWSGNVSHDVWAFLRPAVWGNFVAIETDGRNRMANPATARLGAWLVGSLSAPVDGRRLIPPRGRAGVGRGRRPPLEMWMLAQWLRRYRPLTAEHMMWAARPTAQPFDRPGYGWRTMHDPADPNRGTNPVLASRKFTGDGIVMRAAVGTSREMSLHLVQIDNGPNYGQGSPARGGCGMLYYYAAGKAYSGHAYDFAGNRASRDADLLTNFGVWKGDRFWAVGRNDLHRPFYELGVAQFAELLPRTGPDSSAWPEYRGRSVLLVGCDYFILHDAVAPDVRSRFTWAAPRGVQLPFIRMLLGSEGRQLADPPSGMKIYRRDGDNGDCMAFVSHRTDFTVKPTSYGCKVETPEFVDCVFRRQDPIAARGWGFRFEGTAGVVRKRRRGKMEMAIFHGKRISDGTVTLAVSDPDLGISLVYVKPTECSGSCFSRTGGTMALTIDKRIPGTARFYIDGKPVETEAQGKSTLVVELPSGQHHWHLTAGYPQPAPPVIDRTVNRDGSARLFFTGVPSTTSYRVELSVDNGQSWRHACTLTPAGPPGGIHACAVDGLQNGIKVHLRVTAVNPDGESPPSRAYPVYVTDTPPPAPDGLRCVPAGNKARLSWGEVLGAGEYYLYRRQTGEKAGDAWKCIFRGHAFEFEDGNAAGVVPAFPMPGMRANADRLSRDLTVYEYAISAANGNGEGDRCRPVTTHPASWLHWYPDLDL